MKKILFAVALFAVAGTAMAQDKVVRKARDIKEEIQNLMANTQRSEKETAQMNQKIQQCLEMLEPTFTSPETKKELANAWDIKAQVYKYKFAPLLDNVIKKEPTDTAALAEYIYTALDAMEQCYKTVQTLGLKGEKDPYTTPNKLDVVRFRQYIAFCGQMFFQNGQHAKALDAFSRWMKYPQTYTILGADAQALAEDESTPQIAYYTCLCAYFAKDHKAFMEFIPTARQYTQEKSQVNQLYLADLMEQGDTVQWLKVGREVVAEDPAANDGIAQNILAYYFGHDDSASAMAFADEILAADELSKIGNFAKGVVLMNEKKYEEAVKYYDKAIEADPDYSDAYFNAGVCWSNHGYDINEALAGKKMTTAQFNEAVKPVKEAYAKAEPYFLKVKELEPENTHKWASRLATVYYILEDKAKQAEMEKLLE